MAVGLGKNTPIDIQLNRENFNALIERHSQPIRWLVAVKCPCIGDNQKVDQSCTFCKGKGVSYEYQEESTQIELLTAPIDGVIEQDNVIWVRDLTGKEYTIISEDCLTYVSGVIKGQQYLVKYTESLNLSETGTAEYVADKLYRIDLPVQVKFGNVQGDLLSVSAFNGVTPLTMTTLFRNCFEIEESLASEITVTVEYTYINPFQFALIHNNFSKQEQKFLTETGGDGLLIFPQRWEVHSDDIIIALNATQVKKVIMRSSGVIDILPSFYLSELKGAYSLRSGVKHIFAPGTDFVLHKGNQIKWINNPPTENEQVSFHYTYNTAYKVLKNLPAPRTSEDNRFPRKVAVKFYTDFNSREGF